MVCGLCKLEDCGNILSPKNFLSVSEASSNLPEFC
jgi:hypothetical protein